MSRAGQVRPEPPQCGQARKERAASPARLGMILSDRPGDAPGRPCALKGRSLATMEEGEPHRRGQQVITDLRTPSRPDIRVRAVALHDDRAQIQASSWPMATFVGAVLLSLALLATVAS